MSENKVLKRSALSVSSVCWRQRLNFLSMTFEGYCYGKPIRRGIRLMKSSAKCLELVLSFLPHGLLVIRLMWVQNFTLNFEV